MWELFEQKTRQLKKMLNARKIILWGYGYTGFFVEHLLHRNNKDIFMIVDKKPVSVKLDIQPIASINLIDCKDNFVIQCFKPDSDADLFLTERGFIEGVGFINIFKYYYGNDRADNCNGLSYLDWIDNTFGTDFMVKKEDNEKADFGSQMYSPGNGYSVINVLDKFEFSDRDAVFDFGCGKGGALLLFHMGGIKHLGGVEYDPFLLERLYNNYRILGITKPDILRGDAGRVRKELDEYNYYYMFNPFVGETFCKVIANLEESFIRKNREIVLIYSAPVCHEMVVRNNYFRLIEQVDTDFWMRNVNIYAIR